MLGIGLPIIVHNLALVGMGLTDAIMAGQRVVVLDDLLATGGTMGAAIALLRAVGADVVGAACIIELAFLNGRQRIDTAFESVVCYES